MHPIILRRHARDLYAQGHSLRGIGRQLGVPYDSIRYWCKVTKTPDEHHLGKEVSCPRCLNPPASPPALAEYAYLLGAYLGDGHVALTLRVPVLRITCDNKYPGIMDAAETAMRAVLPNAVCRVQKIGCADVASCSTHWPCLFPQAGPGPKHKRRIALEAWQQFIVDQHPGPLLRGLFHSDGCRVMNNVTIRGRHYAYPRYFLANESPDILAIAGAALDRLGIAWRLNNRNSLSVARREAVGALDRHVGPKA